LGSARYDDDEDDDDEEEEEEDDDMSFYSADTGTVIESEEDAILVANGTRCYACNAPFILGECEVWWS
jgi:hypothetical protein